jgi:hypothetical protein
VRVRSAASPDPCNPGLHIAGRCARRLRKVHAQRPAAVYDVSAEAVKWKVLRVVELTLASSRRRGALVSGRGQMVVFAAGGTTYVVRQL